MKILVTGTAGFIGNHLILPLLQRGDEIVGLDCISDYYAISLKHGRLKESGISENNIKYAELVQSEKYPNYRFVKLKLEDKEELEKLFKDEKFDVVVNLAAQAGVRYSITNPDVYIQSNIVGFLNLLECCRFNNIKHFVYASSSSVYGLNKDQPFSADADVSHPVSLYAASKKSNELMAHTYSHLYGIPTTGLRFFTVYGPWGRPDMAPFLFTKAILEGKAIDVFNHGKMQRDFTYVEDIVKGVVKVLDAPPLGVDESDMTPSNSTAPYKIYNIGNNNPVKLMDFIGAIEKRLGIKAEKNMLPMQAGDVVSTYADVSGLIEDFDYKPDTPIQEGVNGFIDWYIDFFKIETKEGGK